jgi:hypothetical protein
VAGTGHPSRRLVVAVAVTARLLAVTLTAGVAFRSVSLLVVGQASTVVAEVPLGAAPAPPRVVYEPYPPAVVPLGAAVLLLGGLLTGRLVVAWVGLAFLGAFALLFLFNMGAGLVPVAGLLLLLLLVVNALAPPPTEGA